MKDLPTAFGPRLLRPQRPTVSPAPKSPTTSRFWNRMRSGHPPPPGRGRERTRAPFEVGGATRATLDSFIEHKPPFARASICFREKQVTAGDAGPAPALYLGPVNASNTPPPPAPPATRFPLPKSRPHASISPPPPHTLCHTPPSPHPPFSPPWPHSPLPTPATRLLPPLFPPALLLPL